MREPVDKKAGDTGTAPVAIVEEELLLSQEERADMVAVLKEAEACVASASTLSMIPRRSWII